MSAKGTKPPENDGILAVPREGIGSMLLEFLERDPVLKALGVRLEDIGPGRARLSMVLRDDHLNGFGAAHGGMLYTLADSCFGIACNTHEVPAVADHCSIIYAAPAAAGDTLTATCQERMRRKRAALYDVIVTNDKGKTIAEFRGHARIVGEGAFPP